MTPKGSDVDTSSIWVTGMGKTAPSKQAEPLGHGEHAVLPTAEEYEPGEHKKHVEAPVLHFEKKMMSTEVDKNTETFIVT